jgi:hypothetical protein
MNFLQKLLEGKMQEAKDDIVARLNEIAKEKLQEEKKFVANDVSYFAQMLDEVAPKRNPNIIKMGRIKKIRRRIRRNAKGKIVIQKNRRRSGIKGFRISGNTVKRIPATERLRKARLLKRSWKTTRRAKIKRSLLKRRLSMRRRKSLGLK